MSKRLQCKDIPDRAILSILAANPGRWHGWWEGWNEGDFGMPSVRPAFPASAPDSLILAKMRRLIARGLVDGCTCGCRGDFEITEAGQRYMEGRKDG